MPHDELYHTNSVTHTIQHALIISYNPLLPYPRSALETMTGMTEKCTKMNEEIVSSEAALAETQIQVPAGMFLHCRMADVAIFSQSI